MKTFLFSILLLLLPTTSWADNTKLIIRLVDGRSETLVLTEYPVIKIERESLEVTAGEERISFDVGRVLDFRYEVVSGIESVETEKNFKFEGNSLLLDASKEELQVTVSDVSGKLIDSFLVEKGKKRQLRLTDIGQRIFIVKANNNSIKIAR